VGTGPDACPTAPATVAANLDEAGNRAASSVARTEQTPARDDHGAGCQALADRGVEVGTGEPGEGRSQAGDRPFGDHGWIRLLDRHQVDELDARRVDTCATQAGDDLRPPGCHLPTADDYAACPEGFQRNRHGGWPRAEVLHHEDLLLG
jgi:hypothetical protein